MALSTSEFIAECEWIYNELLSEAEEDVDGPVWSGTLTRWFNDKRISTDKYSKIMNGLKSMKCVEVIANGNRYSPSIIQLNKPPTTDLWVEAHARGAYLKPGSRKSNEFEQAFALMKERLSKLEKEVALLMAERFTDAETG